MRIKIEGKRTISELRDILNLYVTKIEEEGITHASGINFYFNPYQNDSKVEFVSDDGNPIMWVLPEPKKEIKSKKKRKRHLKVV